MEKGLDTRDTQDTRGIYLKCGNESTLGKNESADSMEKFFS